MKIFFFILSLTLAIAPSFAKAATHYAILINAGSTDNRLHILTYETDAALPKLTDVFVEHANQTLAEFSAKPDQVGKSLAFILDRAQAFLQQEQVNLKEVSLHLLATGGMRLLSNAKQQTLYAHAATFIQNHYPFTIKELRTISGKEEGVYGWLSVNYLLNILQTNRATKGSLDMGGASTQIAFATDDVIPAADKITLTINKQQYTVFSKSFLGLGQNALLETMLHATLASQCFPKRYPLSTERMGDFNETVCTKLYIDLLNSANINLPSTHGTEFVAYSGVYYTYHFFAADEMPSENYLKSRIQVVCHQDWATLKQLYPQIPNKYLANFCAHGIYYVTLLYQSYKLKDPQIKIAYQLKDQEIDWTLGALLYHLIEPKAYAAISESSYGLIKLKR